MGIGRGAWPSNTLAPGRDFVRQTGGKVERDATGPERSPGNRPQPSQQYVEVAVLDSSV